VPPDNPLHHLGITPDKIIRGERPADLPVQQPTQYLLFVNQKTAKALGLTVPEALLARANQVFE
jgi:putative tryptophan/tyrosine transport system substrate-binding protein